MAAIGVIGQQAMLNWLLGGAGAITQPSSRLIGLAVGTPTYTAASEVGGSQGYSRMSGLFSAAASPAGSASNTASIIFGPFSSSFAIMGAHLWDQTGASGSGGTMWVYGTLNTARTVLPGDYLIMNPGQITVTLQ